MDCKQCGGTGYGINNKYCKCTAGKFLKSIEHGKREKEAPVDFSTPRKGKIGEDPKLIKRTIKVGDWVEREGLVCIVDEISGNDVRVLSFRNVYGDMVKKFGWVEIDSVKPMPLEGFDDVIPMAVDLALLTNDPKWFKKVMKVGVTL